MIRPGMARPINVGRQENDCECLANRVKLLEQCHNCTTRESRQGFRPHNNKYHDGSSRMVAGLSVWRTLDVSSSMLVLELGSTVSLELFLV
jgi:hypothetical protein